MASQGCPSCIPSHLIAAMEKGQDLRAQVPCIHPYIHPVWLLQGDCTLVLFCSPLSTSHAPLASSEVDERGDRAEGAPG